MCSIVIGHNFMAGSRWLVVWRVRAEWRQRWPRPPIRRLWTASSIWRHKQVQGEISWHRTYRHCPCSSYKFIFKSRRSNWRNCTSNFREFEIWKIIYVCVVIVTEVVRARILQHAGSSVLWLCWISNMKTKKPVCGDSSVLLWKLVRDWP